MSEKYGPFGLGIEQEKKRLNNLAVCKHYLTLKGPNRDIERMEICTEDAYISLPFGFGLDDPRNPSKRILTKDRAESVLAGAPSSWYPDWSLHDGVVYSTDEPDIFFIECDGRGMKYDPRYSEPCYYRNHYILCINMVDGKIQGVREVFNPFKTTCYITTNPNT